MTFSILARDENTNEIGGAAATGSYCVGGWVLRGSLNAGLSASQGASASTLWGEQTLDFLESGLNARDAIYKVVNVDEGKEHRQLSCMTLDGDTFSFTGNQNTNEYFHHSENNLVVAGNMLSNKNVISEMVSYFKDSSGNLATRLVDTLKKGEEAGSDIRGLKSSSLLVLHENKAPLTLRIDSSDKPLEDLSSLLNKVTSGKYADWTKTVPTKNEPNKF